MKITGYERRNCCVNCELTWSHFSRPNSCVNDCSVANSLASMTSSVLSTFFQYSLPLASTGWVWLTIKVALSTLKAVFNVINLDSITILGTLGVDPGPLGGMRPCYPFCYAAPLSANLAKSLRLFLLQGQLQPVLDSSHSFEDFEEAFQSTEAQACIGKSVITFASKWPRRELWPHFRTSERLWTVDLSWNDDFRPTLVECSAPGWP